MLINEICREHREMLGLTLTEFSRSVNVDVSLYEQFEKGKYMFSNDIMKLIVKSLYVEKEDLMEDDIDDEITRISLKVIEECEKGE